MLAYPYLYIYIIRDERDLGPMSIERHPVLFGIDIALVQHRNLLISERIREKYYTLGTTLYTYT